MKQTLWIIIIGLALWGCSVNDSKESEDANSSSTNLSSGISSLSSTSLSSSISPSSSTSISSSTEPLVVGPSRSLNVIVDYQNYSAWVDTCKHLQVWGSERDTILLDKQVGDTLFFHLSRFLYGLPNNPAYYSFHCMISLGKCDGGPEIFMISVKVQEAFAGGIPWGLAQSDSAVIWNEAWGQPLDSNFTWFGPEYSAEYTWLLNGLIHGGAHGWSCSIQPITNTGLSFFNPETLTVPDTLDIVVDYKNHKKWTDSCGTGNDNDPPDTISLIKTTTDSLLFERRGFRSAESLKDTIKCDLTQRYCFGTSYYETSLIQRIPFNNFDNNSLLDSLGAIDDLLIWNHEWADSLEAFTDQGMRYTSFVSTLQTQASFRLGGFKICELHVLE